MLTQADIDRTDKRLIASHWISSASSGYRHYRITGLLRRIWDRYVKGIREIKTVDSVRIGREGLFD